MAYKSKHILIVIVSWWMLITGAAIADQPISKKQAIIDALEKARTGATSNIRYEAARSLAILTEGIDLKEIDDNIIDNMITLLYNKDVYDWVIASLANLGSRAKKAVPTLYKLYPEEACRFADLTAAPVILIALERIGAPPPPPPKCKEQR